MNSIHPDIDHTVAYVLSLDAFIRSIAVNKSRPICLLLGAGASISSGMPSAQRCIWEWKKEIFVTNNPTISNLVSEISLPGVRQKIQHWLDQRGRYPLLDSPDEYSYYAAACYPTGQDRKSFFQSYVSQSKPHTGYALIPYLAKAGHVKTVWTTNFDGLIAKAAAAVNGVVCIEIGIETADRVNRQHSSKELRTISLHGDYRYDDLKNTDEELRFQEAKLIDELTHEIKDYDLVVAGYSGRDKSLMEALNKIFSNPGKSRLYWCGIESNISENAEKLIRLARSKSREAFYIPTSGFDDLIERISLRLLEGNDLLRVKEILIGSVAPKKSMGFSAPPLPITSLVKSNSYPLACPTQAFKVEIQIPKEVNKKDWLNDRFNNSESTAVTMENGALILGSADEIQRILVGNLLSPPVTVGISETDVLKDNRIQSLLRRGILKSISKFLNVSQDNNKRIWEKNPYSRESLSGTNFNIHRALGFKIANLFNSVHLVLTPEIIATTSDGSMADYETMKVLRTQIYGYQHNDVFNGDLDFWIKKITNVDLVIFGGGNFRIARAPIYAGLAQKGKKPLADGLQKFAKQNGFVTQDANLVFSSLDGLKEIKDPNPLLGLTKNRPWDYQLTSSGLSASIDIAVISPPNYSNQLKRFLSQLQESSLPAKNERDYLQDYLGFSKAFGIPLQISTPGDATWINVDEFIEGDTLYCAKQIALRVCRGIDVIRALNPRVVVAIFFSKSWNGYRVINTGNEHFNFHDYIKAYAARHGQSTQIIREDTLHTSQLCRVKWWLSLAFYAKALRTPWRLDCLEEETAFVGIGYSYDSQAEKGNHILLGCSHLYSARGEGLQFRLGRIENPIIRGKNPYMSEDDARRTGETIRQLFYDARMKLPKRVVVHKRTPFIEEELKGLVQGLEGVLNIELIEVNIEDSLRYLASKLDNGNTKIDRFPIQRGSVIIQNLNTALLWVHGSAPSANNPNFKYYQGKRRIPAPLLIRRYLGQSDIVQVATEILGLSKMNWNTFDYYSKLPATLDSANAIAKVGPYLSGFSALPYDYRLLI